MFIIYKDENVARYVPVSMIEEILWWKNEDLIIYLKTNYRSNSKIKINALDLSLAVPFEEQEFVLAQLHKLAGFTAEQIAHITDGENTYEPS